MPLRRIEADASTRRWAWAEANRDRMTAHWDRADPPPTRRSSTAACSCGAGRTLAEGRLSPRLCRDRLRELPRLARLRLPRPVERQRLRHGGAARRRRRVHAGHHGRPHGQPRQGLFPGRHARPRRRPRRRHGRSGRLGAARTEEETGLAATRSRRPTAGRDVRRRPHGADARGQGTARGRRDPRPHPPLPRAREHARAARTSASCGRWTTSTPRRCRRSCRPISGSRWAEGAHDWLHGSPWNGFHGIDPTRLHDRSTGDHHRR